jgi:uncharacterized membrane protein
MTFKIKKDWHILLLILLIIIGTFLRFYHLDYNSLWLDEAFTRYVANHSLSGIWEIVSHKEFTPISLQFDPYNPPLFYYIEHFMLVFGQNEFVLRFIPALLGALTIPVFYCIGKEFLDKDVGIIMAALLSVSPFHVFYSQEARAYSTMLFLFSLALLFFFVSLRTNKIQAWILFGFFSALTVWTHYYILIPLALLFAYTLYWGISGDRNILQKSSTFTLSLITFTVICLPLVPLLINLYIKRTSLPPLSWGIKGLEIFNQIFRALSGYHRSVMVIFIGLFIIGIVFMWRTDKSKAVLIGGLLAVPILISFFLAERMAMDVRYLFYVYPFFFLGISIGLKSLSGLFKGKNFFSIFVVIFFLIQVPFLALYFTTYYTNYSKEDWRGLSKIIQDNSAEGDYIIVVPYYTRLPLDMYYSNKSDGTNEMGVRNESEILPILPGLKNNTAFFVVTGHMNSADPDGSTRQWLDNNTQHIASTRDIELFAFNLSK